jgi:hypothetical protein
LKEKKIDLAILVVRDLPSTNSHFFKERFRGAQQLINLVKFSPLKLEL